MKKFVLLTIIVGAVLAMSCRRRVVVGPPPVPPVSDETLYKQGLAAFHEGTPESYLRAADAFRKASAAKPDRCEYALNLAQSLWYLGSEQLLNWEEYEPRQTEAKAIVDSVALKCTPSFEPFVLRLRALIAGRGPTAAGLINRAVDGDPMDALNWVVLGNLDPANGRLATLAGSGRWIAMTRAVELQPESALIQYELGRAFEGVRDKELDSARAFQRAVELSPRHFRAYLGLAYSADDNVDVEPLYRKVVEIAPRFLEGRTALGSYYGALDEIEKASEQYQTALEINPKYDIAHFRLGLLTLGAERPTEAEMHFKKVVELNPSIYEAYYLLGNIFYARRELDEAKRQYEQAVKIRVNYAEAEYGIGWIFRMQDQNDQAVSQFDKTIRLQLRYGDAYLSRGDIRAERQQFTEALADYQKAIETYEDRIKSLSAEIAFAESRPQSRVMQAEKKRKERDKSRVEAILQRARESRSLVEDNLKKIP